MVMKRGFTGKLNDSERGYLIGFFRGDGYAHHDRKQRHYVVEFYLHSENDAESQEYLVKILKRMGLNVFIMKDKRYKCNRVKVNSKALFYYLGSEHGKTNPEFMSGFISGLIDSEGYVNFRKSTISIANTDLELLNTCRDFLKALGFKANIKERVMSRKDRKKSYIIRVPFSYITLNTNSLKIITRNPDS